MPAADGVERTLGEILGTLRGFDNRLDKIEARQDKTDELVADVKHMRANIAMMKEPVQDYQNMKQRGIGAWTLITLLAGGATVIFNIVSYVVRVYVLNIGN